MKIYAIRFLVSGTIIYGYITSYNLKCEMKINTFSSAALRKISFLSLDNRYGFTITKRNPRLKGQEEVLDIKHKSE